MEDFDENTIHATITDGIPSFEKEFRETMIVFKETLTDKMMEFRNTVRNTMIDFHSNYNNNIKIVYKKPNG